MIDSKDYAIYLDIKKSKYSSIELKELDSAELTIYVIDNGTPKDISGNTFILNIKRNDGTLVVQNSEITIVDGANGVLMVNLNIDALRVPGTASCELEIHGTNGGISTGTFFITVTAKVTHSTSPSSNTSTITELLQLAIAQGQLTKTELQEVIDTADLTTYASRGDVEEINASLAEIPYQLKATDNLQTILDSGYRVIKLNPKNTYTFGSTALPSNTTIIGNNATITHNSANGSLFTCYGTSQANKINITIKDLIIVGIGDRVDTTRSVAIDCEYVKNVSLVNCEVNSFNVASRFNNCDNVLVKDNYLHDIKETSDTIHGYGVLLENSTNVKIINNQCDNIDRHTFYLNMGYNVFISGNIVNSPQAMVSSTVEIPIKLTTIKKVVITNNILRYGLGGIYFVPDLTSNDPLTGAEDVLIANNVFEDRIVNSGFATGYIWSKSASPTNIVIRNNIFRNSTDHCINIEGGLNITISDNEINTSSLSGAVAIRLTAGTGASSPKPIINNNTIRNYTTGISNASGILPIGRNNLFESVTTPISNSNGSDCLILDSQEVGYSRHIITGATPSVALGTVFTTNDAGSTTVTNYLGGTRGQVITIFFVNVNTTVQHGTNIKLKGAVNFASASGKSLTLIKEGAAWYEIGRTE